VLLYDATTLNARGALYARVESGAFGDIHLFGTHLSPGIHAEQTRQIDQLFAWIDAKAANEPTVVVGDLNTGPSVGEDGSVPSHLPALYRRFADAGFANPYLEGGAAQATFGHGSLTSGRHPRSGWVIDHVLVRDVKGRAHAARVLDQPVTVTAAGRSVTTTYSDHCGVQLTLERST